VWRSGGTAPLFLVSALYRSGQLHAPAALPGKESPTPTVQEAGLVPHPVWTSWRRESSLAPPGIELRPSRRQPSRYTDVLSWAVHIGRPYLLSFKERGEAVQLHAFYILTADCRKWSALRSSDVMKSDVLKGVNKKVTVSWDVTQCSSLQGYQRFREIPNVGTCLWNIVLSRQRRSQFSVSDIHWPCDGGGGGRYRILTW
jgi:hypothetical protein